jgi:hypothetical protein
MAVNRAVGNSSLGHVSSQDTVLPLVASSTYISIQLTLAASHLDIIFDVRIVSLDTKQWLAWS